MNKILMTTVGLTIAIIVTAGVLMPVLSDATETEKTFKNEGYFYLDKITNSDDAEYTISWSSAVADTLVINGDSVNISDITGSSALQVSIFMSETDMIRIGSSNGVSLSWVQVRGETYSYRGASTVFSAVISNGTVTLTMDNGNYSLTYREAYMIDPDGGDYVMKKSGTKAYLLDNSVIYGIGITNVAGTDTVFKVAGNVESVAVTCLTDPTVTIDNISINDTEVSSCKDLYLFDNVSFDATNSSGTVSATYSYVVVPAVVTAELAVHLDPAQIAILAAIPIFMIVAILLLAATIITRYRQ